MVDEIIAAASDAGVYLGGPQAWMNRSEFDFFQGPPETALVRIGVQSSLASAPTGVAPIEGEED